MSIMGTIELLVLDTETGGLNPAVNPLLEIAAAHVTVWPHMMNGVQVRSRFESKVAPRFGAEITTAAASINGYTPEAWSEAQRMVHVGYDFLEWLDTLPDNLIWTGSNVQFDLDFLEYGLGTACGLDLPQPPKFKRRKLNTESLCFPLLVDRQVDSMGLAALRKWAGAEGEQTHRAMDDVNDTITVIAEFFKRVHVHQISKAGCGG